MSYYEITYACTNFDFKFKIVMVFRKTFVELYVGQHLLCNLNEKKSRLSSLSFECYNTKFLK